MKTQSRSIVQSPSAVSFVWTEDGTSGSKGTQNIDVLQASPQEGQTSTLFQLRRELVDEVIDAHMRARELNWDSEKALAVTAETCQQAIDFARALPLDCPQPEVIPFPDGSLVFEWNSDDGTILSASLKDDNTLAYAMYAGEANRDHALRPFQGFGVPDFEKLLFKYIYPGK